MANGLMANGDYSGLMGIYPDRSGVYTLPQKKRNFSEVAFLLGRSVGQ